MTVPLSYVGRLMEIWMVQGIPQEIKVTSITDTEVIGDYRDGTECHLIQKYIIGYWTKPREQIIREQKSKRMKDFVAKKKETG